MSDIIRKMRDMRDNPSEIRTVFAFVGLGFVVGFGANTGWHASQSIFNYARKVVRK
jgi:hypothetical protein